METDGSLVRPAKTTAITVVSILVVAAVIAGFFYLPNISAIFYKDFGYIYSPIGFFPNSLIRGLPEIVLLMIVLIAILRFSLRKAARKTNNFSTKFLVKKVVSICAISLVLSPVMVAASLIGLFTLGGFLIYCPIIALPCLALSGVVAVYSARLGGRQNAVFRGVLIVLSVVGLVLALHAEGVINLSYFSERRVAMESPDSIEYEGRVYYFQEQALKSARVDGSNDKTHYKLPLSPQYRLFALFGYKGYVYFASEEDTSFGDTGKVYNSFRLNLSTNSLDPEGSSVSSSSLNTCFDKSELPSVDKIRNNEMYLTDVYRFSTAETREVIIDM